MPSISTADAQGLFTKMVIDVYKQRTTPTAFLRSFFPTQVAPTLELSIEVQRNFEKVAVDVMRGSDGNRNSFAKSTEKIIIPPYFSEWFDATQLQLYDRLYGASTIDDAIFAAYINSVVDAQVEIQNKIERAYEKQCADVLTTGVVTLNDGSKIDFKRKPTSIVDPGVYWDNNSTDPYAQIEAACVFLRQVGKASGGMFNMLVGSKLLAALLANTKFTARQNLFNMALDIVNPPQRNAVGATLHGILTAGSFKVAIWAYPQFYDNAQGAQTPYLDDKKAVFIPENPHFKLGFAAVPQLITPGTAAVSGAYMFREFLDQRSKAHVMYVESAGIAIPTAVDTIYTLKALA